MCFRKWEEKGTESSSVLRLENKADNFQSPTEGNWEQLKVSEQRNYRVRSAGKVTENKHGLVFKLP